MPARLDNLEDLRTFVQIVDSGSLTAAGRVLGIPTNMVSRRLARLEAHLGVSLAQRTTRSLRVSKPGRELYLHAQGILARVDEAEVAVAGRGDDLVGEMRISAPSLIASHTRGAFHRLLTRHPKLRIHLLVSDRANDLMIRDIVERGLDAAVLAGPLPDRAILAPLLGRLAPVLAASRRYVDRHGVPDEPEQLQEHECLSFVADLVQSRWKLTDHWGRERVVRIGGRFASNDSRLLREALADGLGIGPVLPGELASCDDLVAILPGFRFERFDIRLGYSTSRRGSARIAALIRELKHALSALS